MMQQQDAGVLEQIAAFDVPTIANAIEFFNVRAKTDGFMASSIRSIFGSRKTVLGYAATAKMSAVLPPTERQKALLTEHYHAVFETPSPSIAVIQDIDERPIGSLWGEVHATVHLALGCVATITNGGVRDLEEVRSIGFDYFATCTLVSHAHVHLEDVACPVTVGGLVVGPGDLLAADQHGVVSIPAETVSRLPEACRHAQEAELPVLTPCRERIKQGKRVTPEELATWRAEMVRLRGSFR